MYTTPLVIFLFGLMLILIHCFSSQLPIWLGLFGLSLVYCAKIFPAWQGWALMVLAYLLEGIFLLRAVMTISVYAAFRRIEPKWNTWVLWATTWPYAVVKLRLR